MLPKKYLIDYDIFCVVGEEYKSNPKREIRQIQTKADIITKQLDILASNCFSRK